MGITCLTACPECSRHVRCGERACPFCGARVTSFMRVLEYRITTRLDRYRGLSLGAALTAAGFVTSCDGTSVPLYGISCTPTTCPDIGGAVGNGGTGGSGLGGTSGANTGGASGGGTTALGGGGAGGDGGEAGTPDNAAGEAGIDAGGADGAGGDASGGVGGD